MMKNLQDFCKTSNKTVSESVIREGECFAGLNKDSIWYRWVLASTVYSIRSLFSCWSNHISISFHSVIIQRVMSAEMIVAYNCDYGDIEMLTINDLRPLTEEFLVLPQLAIKAKLYGEFWSALDFSFHSKHIFICIRLKKLDIFTGVRPKNKDWSTDDCTRFQNLTVDKRFASEIKAIKRDRNKYELELILIDVSTDKDIIINKLLIDEGRANGIFKLNKFMEYDD